MERVKDNEQKFIDLKELDSLVPKEWHDKINLLYNKDIPKQPKTADELIIYRLAQLKETDMQQFFYKSFKFLACEMKLKNMSNELEFVQNDNGDTAGGQLSQIQRMVLYKRKKAEGSRKGYPDCSMHFSKPNHYPQTIFCEVKKIAAPSGINLREEQLEWFLKLNKMGFDAYITNNPTFFRDVILKKIKNYFI
ncbi:MAG: hypothetical protein FJ368_03140 [Pelagibacterales bacterium]|nr:hypothetical protein [Pelagibacterales bacterium]